MEPSSSQLPLILIALPVPGQAHSHARGWPRGCLSSRCGAWWVGAGGTGSSPPGDDEDGDDDGGFDDDCDAWCDSMILSIQLSDDDFDGVFVDDDDSGM